MEYWKECLSEAFDEVGIVATDEQITKVANDIEISHQNYGMAYGHDAIPNPLQTENDKIKKDLKDERDKVICEVCSGKGNLISYGGTFQSISACWKCKGEGKYLL